MPNPFLGILSDELKQTYRNMIDALIASDGCATTATVYYGQTKFNLCNNCVYDPIGNKSANRYISGGPVSFGNGQICPVCHGQGRIPEENSETISIVAIWDSEKWMRIGTVNEPNNYVQTLCSISLYPTLTKAQYIIFDTNIYGYVKQKYEIDGSPQPCGLGSNDYLLTMWKKV